jgi:hypothetical protein
LAFVYAKFSQSRNSFSYQHSVKKVLKTDTERSKSRNVLASKIDTNVLRNVRDWSQCKLWIHVVYTTIKMCRFCGNGWVVLAIRIYITINYFYVYLKAGNITCNITVYRLLEIKYMTKGRCERHRPIKNHSIS